MRSLSVLLVCACATIARAPARAQTPAVDPAWDAAAALEAKHAYAEAAAAFDAWAQANPDKPRFGEGLTEAGVCWFTLGRERLKLLRGTPESKVAFDTALGYFDRVIKLGPGLYGARAQYMRGSTRLFMGDMPGAESEYSAVLDTWKGDAKYLPKSIERRALVRRNLLHTLDARADLDRYMKEYPKGDQIEAVKRYAQYCTRFDAPAPALAPKAWVQGEPKTLESLRGDVVALYFFATWCENCEAVRPFVLDVFARYEALGVHMIGVVDDSKGQTIDTVKAWLPIKGVRFPVMMDSGRTVASYQGSKIPDIVLIDRAGRLRWHDNPYNLPDSTIEALLLEDPSTPPSK